MAAFDTGPAVKNRLHVKILKIKISIRAPIFRNVGRFARICAVSCQSRATFATRWGQRAKHICSFRMMQLEQMMRVRFC